jgi:hypothetical protein
LLFKYANIIKNQKGTIKKKQISFKNFNKWALSENNDNYQTLNSDSIKTDWEYIANTIMAEVAKNLYDKNAYYKTMLTQDKQFQAGLNNMHFAKSLLK